jgi:hypothetical protein
MKNLSMMVLAGLMGLVVACGGSKEETKTAEPAKTVALVARPADDALIASCVKMREQLQLCREQSIDMLMEERAKTNAEINAALADATKKAEMRTLGLTELDADGGGGEGTLGVRTEKCKEVTTRMPAQIPQPALDAFNTLSSCWDKPCQDRANCVRPFVAQTLTMQAAATAPAAK